MSDLSDADLLSRISKGDTAAMRLFYDRYHARLHGFLRGRGAAPDEADDAIHDTMLAVWKTADRFEGASSARSWLFSIARNRFVDRTRKTARLSFVDEVPDCMDEASTPEEVTMAASDADRVRRCLENLKPDHRTVLRLLFYEDLSIADVSEIEGVPEGTVKSRIFHAKRLMMNCLGKRD